MENSQRFEILAQKNMNAQTCNSPQDKLFFKNEIIEQSDDKSEVKKSLKNDKKRQRLMIGIEKHPKKINKELTEVLYKLTYTYHIWI